MPAARMMLILKQDHENLNQRLLRLRRSEATGMSLRHSSRFHPNQKSRCLIIRCFSTDKYAECPLYVWCVAVIVLKLVSQQSRETGSSSSLWSGLWHQIGWVLARCIPHVDSWFTDITSLPTATNGPVVGRVHWMRGWGVYVWVRPMESMIYCTGLCVEKGKTGYIIPTRLLFTPAWRTRPLFWFSVLVIFVFHHHCLIGVSS